MQWSSQCCTFFCLLSLFSVAVCRVTRVDRYSVVWWTGDGIWQASHHLVLVVPNLVIPMYTHVSHSICRGSEINWSNNEDWDCPSFCVLERKSVTETCHYPFLLCLITHVCDFEHKLKIPLWMLSLCLSALSVIRIQCRRFCLQRFGTLSLGEQCRSDCKITVPLSANGKGLLHCLNLTMAVLSCGALETAHWTARRRVSEWWCANSALGQKILSGSAATVVTVYWWLLVLPFLLLFILLNKWSGDCKLDLWIRALSNTLSCTVLEDSVLLADDTTSLGHLFYMFWMDASLSSSSIEGSENKGILKRYCENIKTCKIY